MPTISDVARAAGVGIGTVSRVINRSPLVSKATRQRVQAAIERLGYQPSPIARAFGRRTTHKLELLVPLFAAAFFLDILRGIEAALADSEYTLLMRTIDGPADRDRVFDACCRRRVADGVLVVWTPPTEAFIDHLASEALPAVLLNAVHARLWSVAVDHTAAAHRAVTYCLGLGHRRIALVDRFADPFASAGPGVCELGYRTALADAGLSVPTGYEHLVPLNPHAASSAFRALQALHAPPTAIVVGSDTQAVGVLDAARSAGLQVPRDLSIVSYNDNPVTQYLGLTTMRVPLRDLGRQATAILVAALAEPGAPPTTTYLPAELLVRRTCAPPAH
jgi:DNA-binding LacI/PurR family transcriptional regulator